MAVSKIINNRDTGWQDVQGTWAGSIRKYRVKNGVCYLTVICYNGDSYPSLVANTWTTIGTLPEGARPSTTIYSSATNRVGVTAEIQIGSNGSINVITSQTTKVIAFSVSFPI